MYQRRTGARLAISREALHLIERDGDRAYETAREFARIMRDNGRHDLARYWSYVARNIAFRTGREIGVKAADRYERDRKARGEGP